MKEICKKVENEINEYQNKMIKQGAEYCYNHSYEIAMMEELNYFFTDYVYGYDEDDEFDLETIAKYDSLIAIDNLCEKIIRYFVNFTHPERFNFYNIESLIDIIDYFIKDNITKEA